VLRTSLLCIRHCHSSNTTHTGARKGATTDQAHPVQESVIASDPACSRSCVTRRPTHNSVSVNSSCSHHSRIPCISNERPSFSCRSPRVTEATPACCSRCSVKQRCAQGNVLSRRACHSNREPGLKRPVYAFIFACRLHNAIRVRKALSADRGRGTALELRPCTLLLQDMAGGYTDGSYRIQ
jgi:hypothetical protein